MQLIRLSTAAYITTRCITLHFTWIWLHHLWSHQPDCQQYDCRWHTGWSWEILLAVQECAGGPESNSHHAPWCDWWSSTRSAMRVENRPQQEDVSTKTFYPFSHFQLLFATTYVCWESVCRRTGSQVHALANSFKSYISAWEHKVWGSLYSCKPNFLIDVNMLYELCSMLGTCFCPIQRGCEHT